MGGSSPGPAAPCNLTSLPGALSHALAPLTAQSRAGGCFPLYLDLIIKLQRKLGGPDLATLLTETLETEAYLEFTA